MEQPRSRRLLGVAAVIVIGLFADLLPSGRTPTYLLFGDQHVFIPTIWDILATFAIFAVGGVISRSRFVPVAATFIILSWLVAQYMLYRIALPAGQANITTTAIGNIPSMVFVLASAVVGAYVGEQVYSRMTSATPSAVEG